MCTISFVPTADGFRLAMNRDEKRNRIAALPPDAFEIGGRRVLCPREPSGGTWLAVNDAGLCLALINWHRVEREPHERIESRGHVIPKLMSAGDSAAVTRQLRRMPLQNLRPFRLLVIDPNRHALTECQWNLRKLVARRHDWQTQHWFSSGYDERQAEKERTEICHGWSLGNGAQLRELHASHLPKRGPFSICMHRPDAMTVSYSEIVATTRQVTLRYLPGPPCRRTKTRSGTRGSTSLRRDMLPHVRLRAQMKIRL